MTATLRLSPQNIRSHITLEEAIQADYDWVNRNRSNRAIYGIVLGHKSSYYEYNFKIFGVKKIDFQTIRTASPSMFYNRFEYEISKQGLKISAEHPALSDYLFYLPRVVRGLYGALFLISRKSKFYVIVTGEMKSVILISVRVKILDEFRSGVWYPGQGYFKSQTGAQAIQVSKELNKESFTNTLTACFAKRHLKVITGLVENKSKNEIIEEKFKRNILPSTYNEYTKEIRNRLKDYNNGVKMDMDYFINICQSYFGADN